VQLDVPPYLLLVDGGWDHITFAHYAAGNTWSTPIDQYPFLGDGDVSPVLWSLHRRPSPMKYSG
jgi:hypothetical protein